MILKKIGAVKATAKIDKTVIISADGVGKGSPLDGCSSLLIPYHKVALLPYPFSKMAKVKLYHDQFLFIPYQS